MRTSTTGVIHRHFVLLVMALSGWPLLAWGGTVRVDVTTSIFPNGSAGLGAQMATDSDVASAGLVNAGLNISATGGALARVGSAAAAGTATAGFGLLQVNANASATENFNTNLFLAGQANVLAYASYEDDFSFVAPAPALVGTTGSATLNWTITGTSGITPCGTCLGSTDWSVNTSFVGISRFLGNRDDTSVREFRDVSGGMPIGGFPMRPLSVTIEFQFGNLLTLGQEARASPTVLAFSTDSPGPLTAISAGIDLGNTIQWLGVSNLRDFQGNAVGCAVTSTSGTDWCVPVNPVPLPATGGFLATALAAVLVWSRRVRSGRKPS